MEAIREALAWRRVQAGVAPVAPMAQAVILHRRVSRLVGLQ
jgi:hypothetical protein